MCSIEQHKLLVDVLVFILYVQMRKGNSIFGALRQCSKCSQIHLCVNKILFSMQKLEEIKTQSTPTFRFYWHLYLYLYLHCDQTLLKRYQCSLNFTKLRNKWNSVWILLPYSFYLKLVWNLIVGCLQPIMQFKCQKKKIGCVADFIGFAWNLSNHKTKYEF